MNFDLTQFENFETQSKDQVSRPEKSEKSENAYLLTNAKLLLEHNEIDLAIGLSAQALNRDAYSNTALRILGSAFEQRGEYEQAHTVYNVLCEADYGFQSLSKLARSLYQLGRKSESFHKYEEALSTMVFEEDGLFEVYKNMGNLCVQDRDFEGAEEYYAKALTLNPRSDQLFVNFGTLAIQKSDWNDAAERFRMALSFNSNNDKAWVGLAIVHNQLGDFELAKANIANAVEVRPDNRTAVQLAAQWYVRDHQLSEASAILQNYMDVAQSDSEISLILIHVFCMMNRFDFALLELERMLLWDPEYANAVELEKEILSLMKC